MFSTCNNHIRLNRLVELLYQESNKMLHFMNRVFLGHLVTIIIVSSYRNMSFLKKCHFLDLVSSVHVVTIKIVSSYRNMGFLKKCRLFS